MKMPKLYKIRIDDTLQLFDASARPTVEKQAQRAISSGGTVIWEDGTTEWQEVYPHIDPTKSGSKIYTWDKQFNKVRADVVRVTKAPSGEISKRKIGTRFVVP